MNAANSVKFTRLWNGDITGYPSNSKADSALCSMLAFYCNENLEQMDRLFRQSGLHRNKWDEQHGADTYGNMTIKNAFSKMQNFYQPVKSNARVTTLQDFIDHVKEKSSMLNTSCHL